MGWWVTDVLDLPNGTVILVSWVTWVLVSIVLHELAHGWTALGLGDSTPRDTGHLSWNPLVHLGPVSLIVFAIIGIAWGAMPVDPSRLRGRFGEVKVLLAGPGMNALLALGSLGAFVAWGRLAPAAGVSDPLYPNFSIFFKFGVMLNVALALFNMMPVLPLDGGRILAALWPAYRRFASGENGQWVMLGGFLLVFWFAGDLLFGVGFALIDAVEGLTGLSPGAS